MRDPTDFAEVPVLFSILLSNTDKKFHLTSSLGKLEFQFIGYHCQRLTGAPQSFNENSGEKYIYLIIPRCYLLLTCRCH